MNMRPMHSLAFLVVAAMTLACNSRQALALDAHTDLLQIRQVDFTPVVSLGHMVTARTYMPSVAAGGTFRVSCPSPYTGTIEGQNILPQTSLPPNVLTVGVPAGWLPAQRELPGFTSVPGGTTLSCGYYWTAIARESAYVINLPIGTVIGGETYNDGNTVIFEMYQPGSDGSTRYGCIH